MRLKVAYELLRFRLNFSFKVTKSKKSGLKLLDFSNLKLEKLLASCYDFIQTPGSYAKIELIINMYNAVPTTFSDSSKMATDSDQEYGDDGKQSTDNDNVDDDGGYGDSNGNGDGNSDCGGNSIKDYEEDEKFYSGVKFLLKPSKV